jgi:prepilin-type N-terminal cleavage/methylation domain-containing protein
MVRNRKSRRGGFSLLELVIVVVIIGIIAAIAIPRMSRGSAGAGESALAGDLAVLRNAIEMYAAEHTGSFPTAATASDQLTLYTSVTGATNATKDSTYIFGPYLHKVPALPVGAQKNSSGIAAADGAGVGWIYTTATGLIKANTTDSEVDSTGKKYSDY